MVLMKNKFCIITNLINYYLDGIKFSVLFFLNLSETPRFGNLRF